MSSESSGNETDLIDFHVGSPILPTVPEQSIQDVPSDNLIDTELPALEQKLQTASNVLPPTSRRTSVDVEEILISIDDDDDEQDTAPMDAEEFLDLSNENLEALVVLKSLDDVLNATLLEAEQELDNGDDIDEARTQQVIEDCLLDLDNYLKALDSSCDESSSVSNEEQSSSGSTTGSSEKVSVNQEFDEENLRNKLRLMEENYTKFLAAGCVNRGYVDTEDNIEPRRPLSACGIAATEPPAAKHQKTCATVAVVRRERPALRDKVATNNFKRFRRCSSCSDNESIDWSWLQTEEAKEVTVESFPDDITLERRAHASTECCTGSVVVERSPIHEHKNQDEPTPAWLRSSMRRLCQLNIPSEATPPVTPPEPIAAQERLEVPPIATQLRPVSAPSRLHSSRPRSREMGVSNEPSGRARSSSASSRSRRPRSLSSSVTSLASSVDSAPTPTPISNGGAEQHTGVGGSAARRSCDRPPQPPDMPEATSPLGHWPHSLSSMLACLGCTLGMFNICRFAVLSLHFGANFIFQFFFLSLVFGVPLFTLQLCLGQQLAAGVVDMWRISPLFQGVGVSMLLAQALLGLYSIVGISWMFVFFRDSFITKVDRYRWAEPFLYYRKEAHLPVNGTYKLTETVPDYFSGVVLQRHHLPTGSAYGTIKFQLAFNLAVVWMIVFVALSKGLRSYGKVIYAFMLLPVFGTFVLCAKILGLMPPEYVNVVFPETSWDEFFLNPKSWLAAAQESFLTWGLLGAAIMQLASHNKHKHLLQRDSSLVVIITFTVLLMVAFLANTCVQILRSYGYNYLPDSFERMETYQFMRSNKEPLPPSLANTPVRYMVHNSFVVGEKVVRSGIDKTAESGYQVLRLATELIPATFAVLGSEQVSPFWSVLFYFIMIMFGIAQQLAIWHCVITGIMAIKVKVLKAWETTITFFSCALGFILGLPLATELGIYVVYFMDYTVGGVWWMVIVALHQIIAVFMVRGRPYSGDTIVTALFSQRQSHPCVLSWAPALLSFTWNVILPVALMVLCITSFRNGSYKDMFIWHHAPLAEYWPLVARQIGSILQLLPILIIPFVAVIQSYRYMNNGPNDILDRIQLLYRPPIGEHMDELAVQEAQAAMTTANQNAAAASEDPPPKYTPPPSYTTATGARLAKFLRQSIRRSVRRLATALGEGGSRNQSQPQPPPPDYSAVLVEMNTSEARVSTLERLRSLESTSTALTAAEVASILRSSFRRSTVRQNFADNNNLASLSAENLVDSAAPIGETSLVLQLENECKRERNTSSVI